MKEDQYQILRKLAKEQGITITQAEEIWSLFCKKIESVIYSDKRVDGIYDINKFPVIHIDNFGKFIPNKKNIRYANMHLKRVNDDVKVMEENYLNSIENGSETSE